MTKTGGFVKGVGIPDELILRLLEKAVTVVAAPGRIMMLAKPEFLPTSILLIT